MLKWHQNKAGKEDFMPKIHYTDFQTYKQAIIICFKQPFTPNDATSIDTSKDANEARDIIMTLLAQITLELRSRHCLDESTFGYSATIAFAHPNQRAAKAAHAVAFSIINYLLSYYENHSNDHRSLISIANMEMVYVASIMKECDKVLNEINKKNTMRQFGFPRIPS